MQRDCFDFFLNFAAVVWMRTEVKPWSFIWPVTTPVGGPARLGTLCSSNWGISFFLFLWESVDWPSPFLSLSLSLCLCLSPFHQAESCGLVPSHWQILLLSFCFPVFTKSLETFCLLFPTDLLMFSVSFLSLSQTCRWVNGSRTAAVGIPVVCLVTPSPSTTPSVPRPPLWWRRRSVLDKLYFFCLFVSLFSTFAHILC